MTIKTLTNRIVKEDIIKDKIKQELTKLNYNFSYKGTTYLIETIYILYLLDIDCDCILEKDIYPIVAQKFECSTNNIKCNITNSTDKMCYDCDEKKLLKYLGDYKFSKPGPKRIVFAILNKIKY